MSKKAKTKTKTKPKRIIGNITWSILLGLFVITIVLALLSFLVNSKDIPTSLIDIITIIAVVMGCFLAGFNTAKKKRENGMILGAICGCLIYALMLGASLSYEPSLSLLAIIKLVVCSLSGAIGGVVGVNVRKSKIKK